MDLTVVKEDAGAATGTSKIRLPKSIPLFVMPVENAFAFPDVCTVLIQNGCSGASVAHTYRRPRISVMGSFATPSIKYAEENMLRTLKVCSIGMAVVVVVVEVFVVVERVDAVVDT